MRGTIEKGADGPILPFLASCSADSDFSARYQAVTPKMNAANKGAVLAERPLDGPFKSCIFIKNNNLSALPDSAHNKPSSRHCSLKMLLRSRAKSRVIGCIRAVHVLF